MTGHQALAIIQSIPLPRRDDFCIRAMVLALPKNKTLTIPDWVRYKLETKRQQGGRDGSHRHHSKRSREGGVEVSKLSEVMKACPCGSFRCDILRDCAGGGFVYCLDCGGETDWFENISDAIAAWDAGEVEMWK